MSYSDSRKNIQAILANAGLYSGAIDGIWGTKTKVGLATLEAIADTVPFPFAKDVAASGNQTSPADAPTAASGAAIQVPRTWPLEADADAFYGDPRGANGQASPQWESVNLTTVTPPYPMHMDAEPIHSIRCHKRVADSLLRILNAILAHYGNDLAAIKEAGLDAYDGCYNFRSVRGYSRLSMHAYGAAIDFDAEKYALGSASARMPDAVVAIIKAEGCRYGGDYEGRKDPMHFEWCR